MIKPAGSAVEFNGNSDACGYPGNQAKKQSQSNTVSNAKDNGIGYGACEQPQRTMLSAQQIIGEVKTSQHIKASACNTDGRDRVVVHGEIVTRAQLFFSGLVFRSLEYKTRFTDSWRLLCLHWMRISL
jgi:hypothetical protein